jgi:chromosome segregation ATPase
MSDLIKRLREKSQGRVKWFAMNKDESAYFIDFKTTWEAGEWYERQKKDYAGWLEREGVHIVEQRVFTELEELATEAAAAIEAASARIAELEAERDALKQDIDRHIANHAADLDAAEQTIDAALAKQQDQS